MAIVPSRSAVVLAVMKPTCPLVVCFVAACSVTFADVRHDLVDSLPGFDKSKFAVYSGILHVPGPVNGYDALNIHYQFHHSQRSPEADPLVVWHQGGPGGSAIGGLYMEMGYFQVYDGGTFVNPFAWNRIANMLYLETPAGAGFTTGFSTCIQSGTVADCSWDDVTQAEAYALTLQAFFKAFPEFANHHLYLTGESYFGNYGPNIAHYILNHRPFNETFKLKGMALGDSCWDTNCCGPRYTQYDVEFYYGKGLFSKDLYKKIYQACEFPDDSAQACKSAIKDMYDEIGPHDIENVYNNCPATETFLKRTGRDMTWLKESIRRGRANPHELYSELVTLNGGYDWACGGMDAESKFILRPDVRKALHLDHVEPGRSKFSYRSTGPQALTLYPELMKRIRILVYNGDADASVPFQGIQDWISDFETQGLIKKAKPWRPWRVHGNSTGAVAGSMTTYAVSGSDLDFSFVLVRLAGHEVPTYRPEASLTMLSTFLGAKKEATVAIV